MLEAGSDEGLCALSNHEEGELLPRALAVLRTLLSGGVITCRFGENVLAVEGGGGG